MPHDLHLDPGGLTIRVAHLIAVAALAPLIVVAVDPAGLAPFGPLRHGVVVVVILAAAAAAPAGRAVALTVVPLGLAAVLAAVMVVAAGFGVDPTQAFIGTAERRFGAATWVVLVFALLAGMAVERRSLAVLARSLVVAGLLLGAAGVAEWAGWEPAGVSQASGRLAATMGNPAFAGAAAALLLPVAMGVASDAAESTVWRTTARVAGVLLIVLVVGSGARAAWLGLIIAAVLVLAMRRPEVTGRRLGLACLAVAAIALGGSWLGPVDERLASLDDGVGGVSGRVDEWRVGTRVLLDHPVLGVGPEGYRVVFPTAVDIEYEQAHGRQVITDRAHAGLLDIGLAGGVVAVAVFVGLLAVVGRHLLRAVRLDATLAGMAAGVVAYLAAQQVLFPLAELDPLAWVLTGVVVTATARPDEQVSVGPRPFAPVALLVLASAATVFAVTGVLADRRARDGLDAAVEGDPAAAVVAESAVELRSDIVPNRIVLARALGTSGEIDDLRRAVAVIDATLDRAPHDPATTLERGDTLLRLARTTRLDGDIGAAREHVLDQLVRDPYNARAWLLAASVDVLDGDLGAALDEWARAAVLAPRSPVPLVEAARALLAEGRAVDAVELLGSALERDPDDVEALRLFRTASSGAEEGGS